MLIPCNLEFQFKGNRNYIHGTDIYNKMISLLEGSINHNTNFDISFHGIATHNVSLVSQKPSDIDQLKFIVKYMEIGGQKQILYGVNNNLEVIGRYGYPEEVISSKANLKDSLQEVELVDPTGYTFIENTVALNKFLLENIFPNAEGKWYFTRLQLKHIILSPLLPLKLVFNSNFNLKLTKTEILIQNQPVGFIFFSLV